MQRCLLNESESAAFEHDGAVVLRGVFTDWVGTIARGIERNLVEPGGFAAENLNPGETGRFFDDYCNWERIDEFGEVIRDSAMAQIAAEAMQSKSAQFFHDHVLVKEPRTSRATPWHQDAPYYFVEGFQTVSFWIPVDPVDQATLRVIAGSHRWDKPVLPVRWLAGGDFYDEGDYLPVPDPDAEPDKYRVLEWPMDPGDVVLFDFRAVHGARVNLGPTRRRAFSARWVGDDARFITRPGPTSPPFPGHDMTNGDRLREDWFPILWPPSNPDGSS